MPFTLSKGKVWVLRKVAAAAVVVFFFDELSGTRKESLRGGVCLIPQMMLPCFLPAHAILCHVGRCRALVVERDGLSIVLAATLFAVAVADSRRRGFDLTCAFPSSDAVVWP